MEKIEYKKMYHLEQNHWWFLGKKKIVFSMLDKYLKKNRNLKILDIGCGTGAVMKNLQKYGEVYGIDSSNDAIEFCKKRGLKNVKVGNAMNLPFSNNTFDLITCLDVLYHKGISNDNVVIKEMFRVCKKGGISLITDAACMALRSKHDTALHTRERYYKKKLKAKVKKEGFLIKKISYFNFFLFPLIFIIRKLDNFINKKQNIKSNIKKTFFIINYILFSILAIESLLLKFINFPFGVSILCVAKK